MYPEIEKKEKTWKTHGILQRTAVRHWLSQTWRDQTLKTQHDKCSACHGLGHLGQFHWIFRCPRYASIIFFKFKTSSTFPVIMRLVYSILFSLVIPKESYFLLFLNLRKRFIRTWIVQSYSWNNFLTRDTWCCESQVQLLVRFEQHHRARTYLRWLLLLFFAMPHPERYKKYQLGRSSHLLSIWPNHIFFAQPPGETSHDYALFLHGSCRCPAFRGASSAPEAGRRCIGRLRKATPPWSSCWSLRGPRWTRPATTAVALEGFPGRFGRGSGEVTQGVRTLAGDFLLCFGMLAVKLSFFWCWDGPLEIWVKEMIKNGGGMSWNFDSRAARYFVVILFLLQACILRLNTKSTWDPCKNSCDRARTYDVMPHTKSISLADLIFMTLYPQFCPTTRRNIPWLYALFLDGSRSRPAVGVASSAPEAGRRCILRLGKTMPPWSSSWSLRGPRWTRPTTTAVASEGFSGRFWSGSDEVTEGVRTLAADFRAVLWESLGCWVVLVLVV